MEKENFKEKIEAKKNELEVKKTELAEKRKKDEEEERKGVEALVTARVLFISVLDKIYIVILLILLGVSTFINFRGEISSLSYGFFGRVGKEILTLIVLFIVYLFFNWLYKCVSKTMLCLTKNQVYKEKYVPFKRKEISIPLNKITGVSTLNVLWIFRSITIHQYGKLPMIFFTWKNKEFKDKLTELIITDKEKIKNSYENKNLINKDSKFVKIIGLVLAGLVALLCIVRFFAYITNADRKVAGKYENKDNQIVIKTNGKCNVDDLTERDVEDCEWSYDKEDKIVRVIYTYNYTSSIFGDMVATDSFSFKYNPDKKTLTYGDKVFKK